MIFSTLFTVLFFFSSLVCSSTGPSVVEVQEHIKEIIRIIGHDLSPTLSNFLRVKENWDFVLSKQHYFADPNPESTKGVSKMLNELSTKAKSNLPEITGDNSLIYSQYTKNMASLSTSDFSSFFLLCLEVLELLKLMKDQDYVRWGNDYDAYKELFEDAPTPIEFMKMLFDSFKSVAEDMPLTYPAESEIRKMLLLALEEFKDSPSGSDPTDPAKTCVITNPSKKSDSPSLKDTSNTKDQQSSTPWTPLKKFLVFGGIGLVPLSVVVAMVFFFRR